MTFPYLDDEVHIWLLDSVKNSRKYRIWLTSHDFNSICGCSHGWLAFVDEDNNLSLMNPWSRRTIRLLPLQFEFGTTITKVVLSDNPDSAPLDCLVAAIYGYHNTLAFTMLGWDSWTYVDRSLWLFNDVIFDSGRLLASDLHGSLISVNPRFDLRCIDAAKVDVVVSFSMEVIRNAYIVRSCRDGAVLMIRTELIYNYLRILKLVNLNKRFQWHEIQRLEDETLFVGFGHSLSVSCLGIFSSIPNQICEVGSGNGFWNCTLWDTEERPLRGPGASHPT